MISGLGCVLQEADGTPIHSGGEFPVYTTICKKRLEQFCISLAKFLVLKLHLQKAFAPFLKKRQYAKIPPVKTETGWTDYVTGADLFMLNNVDAMFDERFTLYYEETDMLLRLHKKTGRRCVLLDAPKIIHLLHKGRTDKIHFETFSSFHDKLSAVLYFKKHGHRANFLSLLTKTILSLPPNRIWLPKFKQKVEGQAR